MEGDSLPFPQKSSFAFHEKESECEFLCCSFTLTVLASSVVVIVCSIVGLVRCKTTITKKTTTVVSLIIFSLEKYDNSPVYFSIQDKRPCSSIQEKKRLSCPSVRNACHFVFRQETKKFSFRSQSG